MSAFQSTCALCGRQSQLCDSHIVPKFVFKWLKDMTPGGHLRQSHNPNRRIQDGDKAKMLCNDCEQLFCGWEHRFAETIFQPFHQNRSHEFRPVRYERWMLKFTVSVSWRLLCWLRPQDSAIFSDEQRRMIDLAFTSWQEFLLGARPHPENFVQHLIPIDMLTSVVAPGISPHINLYLHTTADNNIAFNGTELFTYAKLGRLFAIGVIQMPKQVMKRWYATKLHVNNGYFPAARNFELPHSVMEYISSRADLLSASVAATSSRQKDKISKGFKGNHEEIIASEAFKAFEQDVFLFGEAAFPGGQWPIGFDPKAAGAINLDELDGEG